MVFSMNMGTSAATDFSMSSMTEKTPLSVLEGSCLKILGAAPYNAIEAKKALTEGDKNLLAAVHAMLLDCEETQEGDLPETIYDTMSLMLEKAIALVGSQSTIEDDKNGLAFDINQVLQLKNSIGGGFPLKTEAPAVEL